MKIIKIFPDYCSSGIWDGDTGQNMDESEISEWVPNHLLVALKYWHLVWELRVDVWTSTKSYAIEWEQDGESIVYAMNKCQCKFLFTYVGDNFAGGHETTRTET